MSRRDQMRWDRKWRAHRGASRVNRLMRQHGRYVQGGVALDLACGLGQNTIWLAQRGCQALGVDVSRVALQEANRAARAAGVAAYTRFAQVDLDHWAPAPASVDVLCVFRFLDRSLMPSLRNAVRPKGLVFYATRHEGVLARQPDANRAYLLARGELPSLFEGWQILVHTEGDENAALVARRER